MNKKTPLSIFYNGRYWYKSIVPYKYKTKDYLTGYKGKYWSYDYSDEYGDIIQISLFECVELSEWLIEKDMKAMLDHFGIKY